MKKLIFFSITITAIAIAACGYAQAIRIDSISIVKPDDKMEAIENPDFNLEKFYNESDAVVYIYRLKSMGVDNDFKAKLKQKEYVVVHIDATVRGHYFYFPDMRYNYVNFKPNTYYYVMLKGFDMKTGYLNRNVLKDLKSCLISKSVVK
jgi:uncharacterized protein YxeA